MIPPRWKTREVPWADRYIHFLLQEKFPSMVQSGRLSKLKSQRKCLEIARERGREGERETQREKRGGAGREYLSSETLFRVHQRANMRMRKWK